MVVQGRSVGVSELELIRTLLSDNPSWGRTRLSEELCAIWDWRTATGRQKDMACRSLLRKLESAGHITLPPPRRPANNELRNRCRRSVHCSTEQIACALADLLPLEVLVLGPREPDSVAFNSLLDQYHYLGHRSCVGEHQRYWIRDRSGRPLSCLLFGSAAWTTKARDEYVGWSPDQRRSRLQWVTNNTRFLILPWINVKNLASHVLGLVCRRIRDDWLSKYGHPVSLLETFVDHSRFTGTCYQAAGWEYLGASSGRTRNSRDWKTRVSQKGIYVRPLVRGFRRELCDQSAVGSARCR